MSAFLNHQLTNVGWDALSTALGGGTLTFFKMQAGSGTIANDAAIPPLTGLVSPVYDIAITSYVIEGDGQITLFGNINSEMVDSGFTFKELGVFATIEPPGPGGGTPSGTGIQVIERTPEVRANPIVPNPAAGTPLMYSYCNSYATSDYIPGKNESTNVVNTVQVTIKIDDVVPTIVITPGEFGFAVTNIGAPTVGPGVWSYTNANIAYLKRLKEGGGIVLSEDANTITIATNQLAGDLDLYVANGNPDISPHFSTIQNAMNYLGKWLIPTTIKARIHVSRGYYSMPGVIGSDSGWQNHTTVSHAQAQNITIQGPQNNTVTGTSISSITGSTNNWNVTVSGISNTSQFEVNDYLIITDTNKASSNNHGAIWGFFKVVSKTASSVTFKVPYWGSSLSISGVNNIKLTPISVILTPGQNVTGISVDASGIGLLQYIGVVGPNNNTKRGQGFTFLGGHAECRFCGCTGYNSVRVPGSTNDNIEGGFGAFYSAIAELFNCAATATQSGIGCAVEGGYMMTKCAATHNGRRGFDLQGGGTTHIWGGWSLSGHNGTHNYDDDGEGVYIAYGHSVVVNYLDVNGSLYTQGNLTNGVRVRSGSQMLVAQGLFCRCDSNGDDDISAEELSLFRGEEQVTGDRGFNISLNTLSSDGAYIE